MWEPARAGCAATSSSPNARDGKRDERRAMIRSISLRAVYHGWAAALAIACGAGDPRGDHPEPAPPPAPPRILSLSHDVSVALVELGLGPSVVGADRDSL